MKSIIFPGAPGARNTVQRSARLLAMMLSLAMLLASLPMSAQSVPANTQAPVVSPLVRFAGKLLDGRGYPITVPVEVTFSLYRDQKPSSTGEEPALWQEAQQVTPAGNGAYVVYLGAESAQGLPMGVFASGAARFLGVKVQGDPELPRVPVVSVPYALKAEDAQTLDGLPASAFLRANPGVVGPSNGDVASTDTLAVAVQINEAISKKMGAYDNLFNPGATTPGALKINNTIDSSHSGFVVSDYMPVAGYSSIVLSTAVPNAGGYAPIWYNIDQNVLSVAATMPAGTPIAVPAGAAYLRIGIRSSSAATMMVVVGSTLPSEYVPFYPAGELASSSDQGMKIGFLGDSITAQYNQWQPVLLNRTGLVKSFQDALDGRATMQMLDGYSGNTPGSINLGKSWNSGTPGDTLAQDVAGLAGLIIWSGTNDTKYALGTPADAAWAPTEYGAIRGLVETLQAANPALRILWITPYNSEARGGPAMVNIVAAIKSVCAQHGIPVLDMYDNSGISAQNWAVSLLSDGVHPTATENTKVLGPMLAEWVRRYF